MAERWFLKVDGIEGESTDAAHKNEIDVESWSWGVSNAATAGGGPGGAGGGGAGKASFDDFHFVSRISAASPPLMRACATGSHIKQVTLSGARASAKSKGVDYLKYQLSDVAVISVQQFGDDEVVSDQFSLNYAKIQVTYTPQTTSGKLGPPVTFGYDIKANKKF